jgi:Fe-S cluster assembly ATP-binding protein
MQPEERRLYLQRFLEKIKQQYYHLFDKDFFRRIHQSIFIMSLTIQNLTVSICGKIILKNLSFQLKQGKVTVLMGPNGSGKSTLAKAIMGVTPLSVDKNFRLILDHKNIAQDDIEMRAKKGIFLAFQNPVAVPGVSIANILRNSIKSGINTDGNIKTAKHNSALDVWEINNLLVQKAKALGIPKELLGRSINEDFSGGEKKKMEMLAAMILKPKFALFDEIDTGLDVDALKIIASSIMEMKKNNTGILIITHNPRILKYLHPDQVLVLVRGEIVAEGNYNLAKKIEKEGFGKWVV